MGWLSLTNWERFQHYKDRDPPWVKLYRDLLTSEAWVLGTDSSRLVQVASVLIAARYSNKIPMKWDLIRKVCSLDMSEKQLREAIQTLATHGFLEIHNDQEDSAAAIMQSTKVVQSASTLLASCTSEAEQSRAEQRQSREDCPAAAPPALEAVPREADWLLDFKLAYPERAGDQNWVGAKRAANARIAEGHTPEQFVAGAKRYAAYVSAIGKARTEFVKQAATFLGPAKPFLEPWAIPATRGERQRDENIAASQAWLAEEERHAAA